MQVRAAWTGSSGRFGSPELSGAGRRINWRSPDSGGRPPVVEQGVRMTVESSPWWARAACRGFDPEWWSDDACLRQQAVEICIGCPVRAPCRADALRTGGEGTVRAGLLWKRRREGCVVASLICAGCAERPVLMVARRFGLYCGRCARRPGGTGPRSRGTNRLDASPSRAIPSSQPVGGTVSGLR